MNKPTHAKPSLYAYYFEGLKQLAQQAGWNLLLHGSLNRDLDLLLVPWATEVVKNHETVIQEFMELIGGYMLEETPEGRKAFADAHHGRLSYVINVNRACQHKEGEWKDPQYYLDISVIPLNYERKVLNVG